MVNLFNSTFYTLKFCYFYASNSVGAIQFTWSEFESRDGTAVIQRVVGKNIPFMDKTMFCDTLVGLSEMGLKWRTSDSNFKNTVYTAIQKHFGTTPLTGAYNEPKQIDNTISCVVYALDKCGVVWRDVPMPVQRAIYFGIERCSDVENQQLFDVVYKGWDDK